MRRIIRILLFAIVICFFLFTGAIAASNGNVTVYYTDTGECYHRANCPHLHSCHATTLEEAVTSHNPILRPCSLCNPPELGEGLPTDEMEYHSSGSGGYGYSSSDSNSTPPYREPSQQKGKGEDEDKDDIKRFFLYVACFYGGILALIGIWEAIKNGNKKKKQKEWERKKREEREAFETFLNGRSIREITGVPSNIHFVDGLPIDNNDATYGNFTVYVSKNGRSYHYRQGCSSASKPMHAFVAKNDYKPCTRCCNKIITVPQWFIDYSSLQQQCKRHGIQIDE